MKQLRSEMTGSVLEVHVKVGDSIKSGQEVAILESMKMEIPLVSSTDGKIIAIHKKVGDFIGEGDLFAEVE